MATALVIGGTGGVGSAVVRSCAREGMNVIFTYLKAEQSAEALTKEAPSFGVDIKGLPLDLRDVERTRAVMRESGDTDELVTVVFAAATGVHRRLLESEAKHWDWIFDANARSFLVVFQETLRPLSRSKGSLIALTSSGGRLVMWPEYSLIGAAKAALESLVRYAAVEAAPFGVRVNAVCPGVIDTKALDSFPNKQSMVTEFREKSPMGRLVTAEEVAHCVQWLARPESSMITGQTVVIDGGWEIVLGS